MTRKQQVGIVNAIETYYDHLLDYGTSRMMTTGRVKTLQVRVVADKHCSRITG
jgi:hypothetical protein